MRLHRLRLTAFQAFAGSEQVDFDALSAAGLFLLHGDTGAGKTTLLDAVCFALYGDVPGARSRDRRLRSDHADPSDRTEVELEVTLRERRLRIVRRPKQARPRLRGDGLTEETATCTVEELGADGTRRILASRRDEADAELSDLLGMSRDQFTQVVLLPQGEFASFLRANSDERRAVLERLFATHRFADVEQWLTNRRLAARGELDTALHDVRDVVSRLSQAAGAEPDDAWEDDLAALRSWSAELLTVASANARQAAGATRAASASRGAADRALAEATELSDRRTRHARATSELAQWEQRRPARNAAAAELTAARAAAPVAPLLDAAADHAAEAERAASAFAAAWDALDEDARDAARARPAAASSVAPAWPDPADAAPTLFDLPPGDAVAGDAPSAGALDAETRDERSPVGAAGGETREPGEPAPAPLRAHAGALRTRAGALGELVAVEARLIEDAAALDALDARAQAAARQGRDATAAIATAAQQREQLDAAVQAARRAADRVESQETEEHTARDRAAQAGERDRLLAERRQAEARVRAAIDAEQDARARWLDVRERRLAGMAAELAADLRPGEPCAVCGATDHPAPAHRHAATDEASDGEIGPSLAEQERAAEERHAALAEQRTAWERKAADLVSRLAAARAVAGDDPADALAQRATALAAALAETRRQAGGLNDAERKRAALATTTTAHEKALQDAQRAEANARAEHKARSEALDADRNRVTEARADAASVAERVGALDRAADACDAAAAALEAADRSRAAHQTAAHAAREAAIANGFLTAEAARAAVRAAEQQQDLERRLREFDDGIAERAALVKDETLVAASQAPAPDLDALETARAVAVANAEQAQSRHAVDDRRLAEVTRLTGDLQGALDALAPVAEKERTIRELAFLVDGRSHANRLHMRLSAYVLAARLEEVAVAATQRLERMSNGRYALVHSDEGARGHTRGGLDLRVVDGWTGQERSPATLSGGETFLASLALALGLADVVTADAGGARLETLFIDEGFGSLDERTLDEVLDVLDGLREGGRAVGIVSHVAELRQRIPAQLRVVKHRNGSHVEQDAAALSAA